MTYKQCAEAIQVSVSTIRRWVRQRRFRVTRLGHKTVRVDPVSFNQFLERKGI